MRMITDHTHTGGPPCGYTAGIDGINAVAASRLVTGGPCLASAAAWPPTWAASPGESL